MYSSARKVPKAPGIADLLQIPFKHFSSYSLYFCARYFERTHSGIAVQNLEKFRKTLAFGKKMQYTEAISVSCGYF